MTEDREIEASFTRPEGAKVSSDKERDAVVETGTPNRAREAGRPKKAKLTGPTIASFKSNLGKPWRNAKGQVIGSIISMKISKYNRAYNELLRLANAVNNERKKLDEDKKRADLDSSNLEDKDHIADLSSYGKVQKSIRAYNKQAEKLAKLSVSVLTYDLDKKKIKLLPKDREDVVKTLVTNDVPLVRAIKVPEALPVTMRVLASTTQRMADQAREEAKTVEIEKNDIIDKVVTEAKRMIDQDPDGMIKMDGNKVELESLSPAALGAKITSLITNIKREFKKEENVEIHDEPRTKDKPSDKKASDESKVDDRALSEDSKDDEVSDFLEDLFFAGSDDKKKDEAIGDGMSDQAIRTGSGTTTLDEFEHKTDEGSKEEEDVTADDFENWMDDLLSGSSEKKAPESKSDTPKGDGATRKKDETATKREYNSGSSIVVTEEKKPVEEVKPKIEVPSFPFKNDDVHQDNNPGENREQTATFDKRATIVNDYDKKFYDLLEQLGYFGQDNVEPIGTGKSR